VSGLQEQTVPRWSLLSAYAGINSSPSVPNFRNCFSSYTLSIRCNRSPGSLAFCGFPDRRFIPIALSFFCTPAQKLMAECRESAFL
jgi:hypothetical protein